MSQKGGFGLGLGSGLDLGIGLLDEDGNKRPRSKPQVLQGKHNPGRTPGYLNNLNKYSVARGMMGRLSRGNATNDEWQKCIDANITRQMKCEGWSIPAGCRESKNYKYSPPGTTRYEKLDLLVPDSIQGSIHSDVKDEFAKQYVDVQEKLEERAFLGRYNDDRQATEENIKKRCTAEGFNDPSDEDIAKVLAPLDQIKAEKVEDPNKPPLRRAGRGESSWYGGKRRGKKRGRKTRGKKRVKKTRTKRKHGKKTRRKKHARKTRGKKISKRRGTRKRSYRKRR